MTITARNYAAQAEWALSLIIDMYKNKGFDASEFNARMTAFAISKSIHFALPDGGIIFNDKLKGMVGVDIRLPFDHITIEFKSNSSIADKVVIIAYDYDVSNDKSGRNSDEFITVSCIYSVDGIWTLCGLCAVVPRCLNVLDSTDKVLYSRITPEEFNNWKTVDGGLPKDDRRISFDVDIIQRCIASVLELLEALTCKNVHTEPLERIDQSKNDRRIKDGKLPLYETKILTVDTSYGKDSKHTGMTHDDRASVRQHLRRGHIRRHPTAGNIWVNACVVGHSELGIIEKQYAVV